MGHFETAPRPSSTDTVRFGLTADLDGLYRGGRPAWNRFEVLGVMAREAFDFNVNLGDVIFADSVFPSPHAVTLPREMGEVPTEPRLRKLRRLRAATGLYSHWDDHEFINDFSVPEYGRKLLQQRCEGLSRLQPGHLLAQHRHLSVLPLGGESGDLLPDLRSFRSASAAFGGRCTNPTTRRFDIAPTLPPNVRERLVKYRRDLAESGSQACTDAIADPGRDQCSGRVSSSVSPMTFGAHAPHSRSSSARPDPAVLRLSARPLGGLRGGTPATASISAAQCSGRRLSQYRCSRCLYE